MIGNHDAHAKNVSIIHDRNGGRIAPLCDAVPILHINDDPSRVGDRRVNDSLALAIGNEFAHHSVRIDHFLAEAESWGAFTARRAESIVHETLASFGEALDATRQPDGGSPALKNRLGYNLERLLAGRPIGKPKFPLPS